MESDSEICSEDALALIMIEGVRGPRDTSFSSYEVFSLEESRVELYSEEAEVIRRKSRRNLQQFMACGGRWSDSQM